MVGESNKKFDCVVGEIYKFFLFSEVVKIYVINGGYFLFIYPNSQGHYNLHCYWRRLNSGDPADHRAILQIILDWPDESGFLYGRDGGECWGVIKDLSQVMQTKLFQNERFQNGFLLVLDGLRQSLNKGGDEDACVARNIDAHVEGYCSVYSGLHSAVKGAFSAEYKKVMQFKILPQPPQPHVGQVRCFGI